MKPMRLEASDLESEVLPLLRDWCDGLLRFQLDMPGRPTLDGAILCPACQVVHGRCHDAVYPLLALARRTGETRYVRAAERLAADADAAVLSPDAARLASALAALPAGRLCGDVPTMTLAEAVGALALDPAAPRVIPPLPLYLHPAVRDAHPPS